MRKAEKLAILQDNSQDWAKLYTPFNRGFVDYLKMHIEPKYREPIYIEKGDKKRFEYWKIHKVVLNEVIELCQEFWPGREIETDMSEAQEVNWVTAVFDAVPDRHIDKLLRGLASVFHPDVGGDTTIMARINDEYAKRRKSS